MTRVSSVKVSVKGGGHILLHTSLPSSSFLPIDPRSLQSPELISLFQLYGNGKSEDRGGRVEPCGWPILLADKETLSS